MKIGLCPGAEYGPAKRWLPERFAEAAAKITEQSSAQWILLGTKNDAAIGEQIAASIGDHCVNRIGQTTLEQLIDELRRCRLLLTNDTGTMHLAALLGVPVVAVFGSTEPRLTGPLGNGHTICDTMSNAALFSPRMSDRFPLYESGQRRRSRRCCVVDARQVNFTFEIERRDLWQFAASLPRDTRHRFQIR